MTPQQALEVLKRCILTDEENNERNKLLELQKVKDRWFSVDEWNRLKQLNEKGSRFIGHPESIDNFTQALNIAIEVMEKHIRLQHALQVVDNIDTVVDAVRTALNRDKPEGK